jgi:L-cystine uptake protein TcyP (sodium:dicarboxylate symporter family)
MSRAKKVLANIGKFVVFALLMGLGGFVVSMIVTGAILYNWTWIFGAPIEGSTYAAIVQVISWALWGFVGALLAISIYPVIFKKLPPRWIGIASIAVIGFLWISTVLAIVIGVAIGDEIKLSAWKDLARESTTIATLWYALSNGYFHTGDAAPFRS